MRKILQSLFVIQDTVDVNILARLVNLLTNRAS
ncbi:MAG: hypothetical protein ACI8SC_002944 [Colwellia sp.]|jgi:hypothetical protein